MNILVTGAAGYIGSIVTEELIKEGHTVIAVDNLEQGHLEAIPHGVNFIQADIGDCKRIEEIFSNHCVEAVMHFAADALVGESMTDPHKYFHSNVIKGITLLEAIRKFRIDKIVFSSSCSVYGVPDVMPITENTLTRPANPYGESKLIFEKILQWYRVAYGIEYIALRYFNAAGASEKYGEHHDPETHLIPNIMKVALRQHENIEVFGTDYPTKDGSCIRDYIHVIDIARAHILALGHLQNGNASVIYNLGNGKGYSVFEVIEAVKNVTGKNISVMNKPRRAGDPPILIADSTLVQRELGWSPVYSELELIIESAWRWYKTHMNGYAR